MLRYDKRDYLASMSENLGIRQMKIVKWVTGIDHSKSPSKLIYPAFEEKHAGRPCDEVERARRKAEDIVKECIRRNGFKFSGEYHQYGKCGMPMFDDGSVLFCSWRHWGSIMAEAWDSDGSKGQDYIDFYMSGVGDDDKAVAPKHELDFV